MRAPLLSPALLSPFAVAAMALALPVYAAAPQPVPAPAVQQAWPTDAWWHSYADPQLTSLIEQGLQGATDLAVADARYRAALASARSVKADLLPTLSGEANGGIAKQSYNYLFPAAFAPKGWRETGEASFRLNWDLDLFGRNRAMAAAARAEAGAAAAEKAQARLVVSTGIAAAYADLMALYAEHDAAQSAVVVRRQSLDLIRQRLAQGLENEGAAARARSGLASAEGELAALDEGITLARHRLAALMGKGPEAAQTIARPANAAALAIAPAEVLPASLLGRRPDLMAARARAEAAAARIRAAKAAFYPNINLNGLIGLQALGLSNLVSTGSDYGSVGPALTLPVFDGGRLRATKRGAEAEYDAAKAQYDGVLITALREVADAGTSQRLLAQRLDSAQAAEAGALASWQVASNRYKGGLATYLDVLSSEDALIQTRRTTASLKARAFALDVAMIRALGGGYRA